MYMINTIVGSDVKKVFKNNSFTYISKRPLVLVVDSFELLFIKYIIEIIF